MRSLRAYRRDVGVRLAPLPPATRAALLAAGAKTYLDVLAMPDAPEGALMWARERDATERTRRLAEDLAG